MSRMRGAGAAVAALLGRLERRIGADREGRSPWVWAGPAITLVGTFALAVRVETDGGMGVAASLPLALVLSLFMGGMSVAYLTAAAADARDAQAPDDGPDHRGPDHPQPPRPPGRRAVRRWVEIVSVHTEADPAEERAVAEPAGRPQGDRG